MNRWPEISVIVPVHRGGDSFRRCLDSLGRAAPPPSEVIAVLDGEDAQDAAIAAEYGVRAIAIAGPGGPARARNRGAAAANAPILFFVDADVTMPADTIERIARAFADDPGLSALIGSYDDRPAARGLVTEFKNLSHHYVHQRGKPQAFTFWGACGAIRREVFASVGGFDEHYTRPSIEDIELGYRLVAAGHRIALHKDLQVRHLKRWTLVSMLRSDFFDRALPWTELILRHGDLRNDLNLDYRSRLSVIAAVLLLVASIAAIWLPQARWGSLAMLGVLLVANHDFYGFLARARGWTFALASIPLHWLHHLAAGAAFTIGVARHWIRAS